MTEPLVVVADRRIMGEIRRDRRGRLSFVYDDGWRSLDSAFPLSLSMPLVVAEHDHARLEPWLWGLLPDNEVILARWGQRFHISPRNAFTLLCAVGEDCPGAIQLVRADRVDEVLREDHGHVDWLTEADIAERLRKLMQDQAAWRMARDNEHLCLTLARALGLPAARSDVRRFEDEMAIILERYDRIRLDNSIRRLHQEDMCLVLGFPPTKKYQNEGGPGCAAMSESIRTHSRIPDEDAWTFARAIMLNWIIGGTDAHAENDSLRIGAGGQARLAPLHDVASTLAYEFEPRKLKMAIRIGGRYRFEEVRSRHLERFAAEVRLPPAEVLGMGRAMAETLPVAFTEVVDDARADGLDHPILERMIMVLNGRSQHCADVLRAESG